MPTTATSEAPPPAGPVAGLPAPQLLAANGLEVVADETVATVAPLVLTQWQASNLTAGLPEHGGAVVGGLRGSDLDAIAPLPVGSPPMSYLLAAWISLEGSPAAQQAKRWMGDADWTRAPELLYPPAAVAMFVAEMAAATDAEMPPTAEVAPLTGREPRGFAHPSGNPAAPVGLCSAVSGFLFNAVNGLFNALRITPPAGGGLFSGIARTLATVWNVAVGFAQGLVEGLIATITEPVFTAIRVGVAALGVASLVLSYLGNQSLTINVEPADPQHYHFGVDAVVSGMFVATAPAVTSNWPPALVDCAKEAGASLPELLRPGTVAEWTVSAPPGLISYGATSTPVRPDHSARLEFATGQESAEVHATGDVDVRTALVQVAIERGEIAALLDVLGAKVDESVQRLAASLPNVLPPGVTGPTPSEIAMQAYNQAVGPLREQLRAAVEGQTQGLFRLTGAFGLAVSYHEATTTTTTSSPSTTAPPPTDPRQQFCAIYAAAVPLQGPTSEDVGAQGVALFTQLQPIAPPELLGHVATALEGYGHLAAGDGVSVVLMGERFANALIAMADYCGLAQP